MMDYHSLGIVAAVTAIASIIALIAVRKPKIAEPLHPPFDRIPRIRAIEAALRNDWKVQILYVDNEGMTTNRLVTPIRENGPDMFLAYCDMRKDERKFRYDRILALRVQAKRADAKRRYNVGKF